MLGFRNPFGSVFCWSVLLLLGSPLHAQTDADVHISPRAPSKIQDYPSDKDHPSNQGRLAAPSKDLQPDPSVIPDAGLIRRKPLTANVDLVLTPVAVIDSKNKAVLGLQKENFELYEDGQKQVIRDFSCEDAPISLGVIFDTSMSMSNKMEQARQAVMSFFKTANAQDDFFIITFSDRPVLLADLTTSIEDIQNRLIYALPHGHTSLLDAIYMGMNKVRHSRYERRALLIISDGGDNRSRYTSSEIKRIVEESDVQLYGIGIFDSIFKTPEERMGQRLLNAVTEATGGRTFAIKDVHELPLAAAKISLELRNQYVISYRSSNRSRDGKFRKLKVKVIPPDGMRQLRVYAKSGYYSAE